MGLKVYYIDTTIIRDGDMEQLTNWSTHNATKSQGSWVWDFFGYNWLRLTHTGSDACAYQSFTTEVGKTYKVTGMLQSICTSPDASYIDVANSTTGSAIASVSKEGAGTWQIKSLTFTATATTTYLRLRTDDEAKFSWLRVEKEKEEITEINALSGVDFNRNRDYSTSLMEATFEYFGDLDPDVGDEILVELDSTIFTWLYITKIDTSTKKQLDIWETKHILNKTKDLIVNEIDTHWWEPYSPDNDEYTQTSSSSGDPDEWFMQALFVCKVLISKATRAIDLDYNYNDSDLQGADSGYDVDSDSGPGSVNLDYDDLLVQGKQIDYFNMESSSEGVYEGMTGFDYIQWILRALKIRLYYRNPDDANTSDKFGTEGLFYFKRTSSYSTPSDSKIYEKPIPETFKKFEYVNLKLKAASFATYYSSFTSTDLTENEHSTISSIRGDMTKKSITLPANFELHALTSNGCKRFNYHGANVDPFYKQFADRLHTIYSSAETINKLTTDITEDDDLLSNALDFEAQESQIEYRS